jgi:hypothetical protein
LPLAPHQVHQLYIEGIAEAMGDGRSGKAHKIARANFNIAISQFGNAPSREDVDEFFFVVVEVKLCGFVSRCNADEVNAQALQADRIPQGTGVTDGFGVEGMDVVAFV